MASVNDGIRFRQFSPVDANFTTPSASQPITLKTEGTGSHILLETTADADITLKNDFYDADIFIQNDGAQGEIDIKVGGDYGRLRLRTLSDDDGQIIIQASPASPSVSGQIQIGVNTVTAAGEGGVSIKSGDATGDISIAAPAGDITISADATGKTFDITACETSSITVGNASTVSEAYLILHADPNGASGGIGIFVDSTVSVGTGDIILKSGDAGGGVTVISQEGDLELRTEPTGELNHGIAISTGASPSVSDGDIHIRAGSETNDGNITLTSIAGDVTLDTTGGTGSQGIITLGSGEGNKFQVGQNASPVETVQVLHPPNACSSIDGVCLSDGTFVLPAEGDKGWWWLTLPWGAQVVDIYVEHTCTGTGDAKFTIRLDEINRTTGALSSLATGTDLTCPNAATRYAWCHNDSGNKWTLETGAPSFVSSTNWLTGVDTRTENASGHVKFFETPLSITIARGDTGGSNGELQIDKIVVTYKADAQYP